MKESRDASPALSRAITEKHQAWLEAEMKPERVLIWGDNGPVKPETPCFYCDAMTDPYATHGSANAMTVEHIMPRAALKLVKRNSFTPVWHNLNTVPACHACNHYKGQLVPLDWLVIMPSHEGAERLARRLVDLGFQVTEISEAMGRRKK